MRKQLVHLKYSGQDFIHPIERCICFAAQKSDRFAENLKNKAIVCCVRVCDRFMLAFNSQ
ncbi:MAG: hypothetical protein V7K89_04825 [Nostoc sp.]|uniref:hypothetical protein n=1 Tax=Nostoc sp. TaxID=1180 RepID=UPI002FF53874